MCFQTVTRIHRIRRAGVIRDVQYISVTSNSTMPYHSNVGSMLPTRNSVVELRSFARRFARISFSAAVPGAYHSRYCSSLGSSRLAIDARASVDVGSAQRALGRLRSAAREFSHPSCRSVHRSDLLPACIQRTSGAFGGRIPWDTNSHATPILTV